MVDQRRRCVGPSLARGQSLGTLERGKLTVDQNHDKHQK